MKFYLRNYPAIGFMGVVAIINKIFISESYDSLSLISEKKTSPLGDAAKLDMALKFYFVTATELITESSTYQIIISGSA